GNEERGSEMGEMMFDMMNLRLQLHLVAGFDCLLDRRRAADVFDLLPHQFRMWPVGEHESEPPPVMHTGLAIDRDMIDIAQLDPPCAQTIINRVRRQPGPVLDPAKPFFLGGSDYFSIDNQTRGRVAVVSIKAKDCHFSDRLRDDVRWLKLSLLA